MNDDTRKLILSEEMNGKLDTILEYVKDVPVIKSDLTEVKKKADEANDHLVIIKKVVKEHSKEIQQLKTERV